MTTSQWLSVAVFGKAAEAAVELKKADRVYIEGTIKLDTWRGNDGIERHGLSVAAFKLEQTHRIGRNRPKRGDKAKPTTEPVRHSADERQLDDAIPF